MDFSGEHEQHEVLHAFLEKYLELVRSYKKGETEFNATVLLELMDEAKDNFVSTVYVRFTLSQLLI